MKGGGGLLKDTVLETDVVFDADADESEVDVVKVVGVDPFVFDVVHNELDVWGDPDRLDGGEVNADDGGAGE